MKATMMSTTFSLTATVVATIAFISVSHAQPASKNNQRVDGYRGIWFTLNQFSAYGDKYSGGLGTYTAHHIPMAIYAPEVNKTFFVYGGTTAENDKYLLCMIGSFDHADQTVSKPLVVHDKGGVDDPHDNPSLLIDAKGYLWVFVSGRNTSRMGYKYRSSQPYSIDSFERVTEEVMTYPQPWFVEGKGYFHFFTKYTGERELYFETSADGVTWTPDQKLAGIKRPGDNKAGHYQVSNVHGNKIVTFFNWHPNGNVDKRTNVYYLESTDFGKSWQDVDGKKIDLPVEDVTSPARIRDYTGEKKNVYLCDAAFDKHGNPVCLYVTSLGHEPGPQNGRREWHLLRWTGGEWSDRVIFTSDHNYDMGSLFIGDQWRVIAPSDDGPQQHGSGGEVVIWESVDGKSWKRGAQVTRNSERNHNYIRRVVNGKAPFFCFWADGNPEKLSMSRLYMGDQSGGAWLLPYNMKSDREKLVKLK